MKEVILTPEGHDRLKEEIEHLSTVKRREVAERIKQAREFGDITENSEYDDAKNEQAMLEHRIATLEERLASARVVNKKEIPTGVVAVGTMVRLRDVDAQARRSSTTSSARPRRIPPSTSSRTSRPSARRSWGTRRARPSRSPPRAGP